MQFRTEADLRSSYRPPAGPAVDKVITRLDDHCAEFLSKSPFMIVSTAAADGAVDGSPKGGPPGFVERLDDQRLAWADLAGNNRLDSFTNLVDNPGIALLFVIPGLDETLRVNGTAELSADPTLCERFAVRGRPAKLVVVVTIREAYLHCAKALRRSALWQPETWLDEDDRPEASCIFRDHAEIDAPAAVIGEFLEAELTETLWMPGGQPAD